VRNVRLVKGGQPTDRVLADDGWPRAEPGEPGEGTVWMGREAVRQGYDVTRIAAHELGHTLSLPDRRTGQCSDLMSGHSAPVDCKNARPSPAEAAEVEQAFQGQSR
jgi:snapalysin